jgi:hypothetical protein
LKTPERSQKKTLLQKQECKNKNQKKNEWVASRKAAIARFTYLEDHVDTCTSVPPSFSLEIAPCSSCEKTETLHFLLLSQWQPTWFSKKGLRI